MSILSDLKCKTKANLITLVLFLGFSLNGFLNIYMQSTVNKLQLLEDNINSISSIKLKLEINENTFLILKKDSNYQLFESNSKLLIDNIFTLKEKFKYWGFNDSKINILLEKSNEYIEKFVTMKANNIHKKLNIATPEYKSLREISKLNNDTISELQTFIALQVNSHMNKSTLLYVISTIFMILSVILMVRMVMRNLQNRLLYFKEKIIEMESQNDLTVDIEIPGKDELSDMAGAYKSIILNFKNTLNSIRSSSDEIKINATKLSNISKDSENSLSKQNKEIESIATAMSEMTASMGGVVTNASEAAQMSKNANEESNKGKEFVENSKQAVNSLEEQLSQSSKITDELSKNTENIVQVMGVIKGVADQTNLLALNAAIEAARAGEQGRGFAVVADEVRTLAVKTQQSTEEINSAIHSLQNDSSLTVSSISRCSDQVQAVINNSNQSEKAFNTIAESMQTISDMSAQIDNAILEQKSVSESLSDNTIRINNISNESLTNSREVKNASLELTNLFKNLESIVTLYKI